MRSDLLQTMFPKGAHALLPRLLFQFPFRGPAQDQFANGRRQSQDLSNHLAPSIARLRTRGAPDGFRQLQRLPLRIEQPHFLGHDFGRTVELLAPGAQLADQSLSDDHHQGRIDQKRLHPHIDESHDRPRCAVGVEGAQDQVPRQRGFDGHISGFAVTDFSHHDDIRILPQD